MPSEPYTGHFPILLIPNRDYLILKILIADRHSSASEDERKEHEKKFKEIGEAYGVLSDAKKRARYDNGHDIDDLEGHGHGGFSNDIDPNQIFQAFFSQGGGGGGSQHFSFGGQGGMPGGFSFQFG